jgi:hypothetical protein
MKINYKIIIYFLLLIILIPSIIYFFSYNYSKIFKETLQSSQKKIAISFSGGGQNYYDALDRVSKELTQLNTFDEIIKIIDNDLKNDVEFWERHGDFITNNKRGYGYWLWKPYIILKQLNNMNENDILVYLDSGCEVINDDTSYININNLFDKCDEYNILYTLTSHDEKKYNKMDLIDYLNLNNDETKNSGMRQASMIFIKKNNTTLEFVKEWYSLCCNYHFIDDSPSILKNDDTFVENRHDQAIFSLLLKTDKYKDTLCTDNNLLYDTSPIQISRKRNG